VYKHTLWFEVARNRLRASSRPYWLKDGMNTAKLGLKSERLDHMAVDWLESEGRSRVWYRVYGNYAKAIYIWCSALVDVQVSKKQECTDVC
jgi:hypothetical protein